ncbi:hypothetical protein RJ641_017391 [Dillenia turbinata]|uniref:Uncharacterized protein n=1 Tax=Dillenia turbinata TaxID=194707 RepID=A0AAN8UR33_9MAGN
MKSGSKNTNPNKLFLCFRPVVDIDSSDFGYISVSRNSEIQIQKLSSFSTATEIDPNQTINLGSEDSSLGPKSGSRKSLSKVFKAVLFEASLSKRFRSRSARFSSFRSDFSLSSRSSGSSGEFLEDYNKSSISKPHKSTDSSEIKPNIESKITKNKISLSSNSIPSNSQDDSATKIEKDRNENKEEVKTVSKPPNKTTVLTSWRVNTCLCLILLSLIVTVLMGTYPAILITMICLIVIPHRITGDFRRQDNVAVEKETRRRENDRKRVIMEGLIQRNHHNHKSIKLLT